MAGGSRAQVNKSHKTRFASKASRNIHKTSVKDKSKISKPDRNAMKGARAARLQRNKMMREQKRAALVKEKRASSGTTSAPRIIVLFGLSASTSVSPVAGDLLALLSNDNNGTQFPAVASSEYRLRATSFGQHARELITSELALRILSILSEEQFLPKMDPLLLNKTLEKIVIKVVPVENLNGRKKVEAGELCERRNGRGVDLNRNWSVDWGKKEKDFDPYEENPGTAPFSEPEAQLMRKLSMSFDPHIWVNVHSGMEALFMPYDHKNTTPAGLQSQKMKLMLETLNHLHCGDRCVVGSGGGSVGYLAHGTTTDYMYDVARVPMSFTFEIYGDEKASSRDCFKMFNPVDHSTFNRVLNEWSATFFAMFNMGAHQMNLQDSTAINVDHLISIDDYLNGYLIERKNRYGEKKEFLDLGLQEIRTYFRLFLLSSVMLMFMFCSRIAKSNRSHLPTISL